MASKKLSNRTTPPKVRVARPSGRPFQVRYTCPTQKREVRISVGSRDEIEAGRLKAEIEAKLLLGLEVRSSMRKIRGPEMPWSDFREEYRTQHLTSLREKSAEDAESRLDIAERIINPKTLGQLAKPNELQRLQTKLLAGEQSIRGKPRSVHTVRGYMKSIVSALMWAYSQDWLSDPPKRPRLKVSKAKIMKGRPISEAEFAAMIEAVATVVGNDASNSWTYLLRGAWESACRIDELMNMSWDLPKTIRPTWPDGKHPILEIPAQLQKNDTDENIPILPGFEALLLETEEAKRSGWIFAPMSLQLKYGRKVRDARPEVDWVGKVISRIGEEAGIEVSPADERTGRPIKYASAHDLRRSCGERLRNAGVPPLVICRVMRHSSWETTRRHYAPGDVQKDAETLRATLKADEFNPQS